MKRKESAFKSMLKQATPPIELDAVWEDVCIFVNYFLMNCFLSIEDINTFNSLFYSLKNKLKFFVEYIKHIKAILQV